MSTETMSTETLNTALWIAQGILAVVFLLYGVAVVMRPQDDFGGLMGWAQDFSADSVRSLGILDIVAGVGLIVPGLLGILPWLTKYVAIGAGLIVLGAFVTHLRRQEWALAAVDVVLALLCVFVWYGRSLLVPL
jgi:uncharacterized membrane protein YphA (DoxX/SURF4 family)